MIRDGERRSEDNPYFRVPYVSNSRFKRLAHESPWARYQDDGLYIFAYGYNTDEGWPRPKSYQTVLFDNTILENFPQSSDILKNSVVLNGNQRWVTITGEIGSPAGSTHAMERPLVTDAFVMEVHQFGGKTYALASVQSSRRDTGSLDKDYDRISRAAVSIGAHFYVPSNQEEFDNVGSWTKGFFR